MRRSKLLGILAAAVFALAGKSVLAADTLTILWAEWDPANYLQELVKDYEKQTGVKVVVETTPWPDFQTKAFTEFAAKGDAYDMVVGDSQWLGAGSTGGHYVDLTDFFKKYKLAKSMAPATVAGYAEYPVGSSKYWAIPLEGDANGWAYRKDWFEDPKEKAAFKAKYGYDLGVPKDYTQLRDIAEFFHRPDEKRYGIAIYTDNSYDALAMGVEQTIFSFGGELGNYATYKVRRHHQLQAEHRRARSLQGTLQVHAARLGQGVLPRGQPGHHRGLGGDEHELLRLLPGARQSGDKQERQAAPASSPIRPARAASALRRAGRPGHLDRDLLEEARAAR